MANEILIVDDEADIRTLLSGVLQDEGYVTREAANADACLDAVRTRPPNLVILDIWLENSRLDGLQILDILHKEHPFVPVVMISGHGNIETAVQAIKDGAYDFIEKPFQTDHMLVTIQRAIDAARLKRENAELRLRMGGDERLVGISPQVNQLRQIIDRVAPTGSRVLVTGAAGVGKEMVARLVHAGSPRANGPFVVLNCAAMHPERMESELFGQEEGGAGRPRKIGTFEMAHGGTLLLDEVADMPLETQGKIVRVLQEQTFERVGGAKRVEVDVRVIASTNRNIQDEIKEGRFREDLFYRLNVVPIRVPSLKERREDIPELVNYFMERAARAAGTTPRIIGPDAMAAMQAYDWPGNIRQLRNVMDWLIIMAPGEPSSPILLGMLPPEISATTPDTLKGQGSGEVMALPLRDAREIFEREYLLAQVKRFDGNVSKTASFVGMERSALHRKLKSLNVHLDGKGLDGEES